LKEILFFVMAGLRPGHPRLSCLGAAKTWMPGTRPGMTGFKGWRHHLAQTRAAARIAGRPSPICAHPDPLPKETGAADRSAAPLVSME
jgi:hypothetical protein